eukprot:5984630-Amphidinium_carterae.1
MNEEGPTKLQNEQKRSSFVLTVFPREDLHSKTANGVKAICASLGELEGRQLTAPVHSAGSQLIGVSLVVGGSLGAENATDSHGPQPHPEIDSKSTQSKLLPTRFRYREYGNFGWNKAAMLIPKRAKQED